MDVQFNLGQSTKIHVHTVRKNGVWLQFTWQDTGVLCYRLRPGEPVFVLFYPYKSRKWKVRDVRQSVGETRLLQKFQARLNALLRIGVECVPTEGLFNQDRRNECISSIQYSMLAERQVIGHM